MNNFRPIEGMKIPRYAGISSFFRLPIIDDPSKVDIGIVGVPWDGGTTNRPGARHGPREIRNSSSLIRLYHPISLLSPYDVCKVADLGDCPVNPADLQDSLKKIKEYYDKLIIKKTKPISIGGDHLISLPILRAIGKNKPLGMFHFDSHSDTWDTYFGGFKYTHGTPFRRAIEENLLDPKRIVMLGIRGSLYDPKDLDWARDQGVTIITIDQFFKFGLKKSMDIAKDVIGKSDTYLSFDIDGIDPTYAPGTGTPEVGGFTVRESQNILRELNEINFIGADLVEVSPPFDVKNQTSLIAANIAFEILCLMTQTSGKQ